MTSPYRGGRYPGVRSAERDALVPDKDRPAQRALEIDDRADFVLKQQCSDGSRPSGDQLFVEKNREVAVQKLEAMLATLASTDGKMSLRTPKSAILNIWKRDALRTKMSTAVIIDCSIDAQLTEGGLVVPKYIVAVDVSVPGLKLA